MGWWRARYSVKNCNPFIPDVGEFARQFVKKEVKLAGEHEGEDVWTLAKRGAGHDFPVLIEVYPISGKDGHRTGESVKR